MAAKMGANHPSSVGLSQAGRRMITQELLDSAHRHRVALVVGLGAYPGDDCLAGPARDARLFSAALKGANFEVVECVDDTDREAGYKENLLKKLIEFEAKLKQYSDHDCFAVFFYAGHGLYRPDDKTHCLVCTDRKYIHFESRVQQLMSTRAVLSVAVLDACRKAVSAPPDSSGTALPEALADTGPSRQPDGAEAHPWQGLSGRPRAVEDDEDISDDDEGGKVPTEHLYISQTLFACSEEQTTMDRRSGSLFTKRLVEDMFSPFEYTLRCTGSPIITESKGRQHVAKPDWKWNERSTAVKYFEAPGMTLMMHGKVCSIAPSSVRPLPEGRLLVVASPYPLSYKVLYSAICRVNSMADYDYVLCVYDGRKYEVESTFVIEERRRWGPIDMHIKDLPWCKKPRELSETRQDMEALASLLNDKERGIGRLGPELRWAVPRYYPGPVLRIEHDLLPLSDVQSKGQPYARPLYASGLDPGTVEEEVARFLKDLVRARSGSSP